MLWSKIISRSFSTKVIKPFYVTTPIFYVNAAPHIGHLYSAVIADAIFRFENLLNPNLKNNKFCTGTDEHGAKIEEAALRHKIPVQEYCDRISGEYKTLFKSTNIEYTDFIRTTEKRHEEAVTFFWKTLAEKEHIYSAKYAGWYCLQDETFLTDIQIKKENDKVISIESGHPVEWTEEINYMFKLGQFQDKIIKWIEKSQAVQPKKFAKILLDMLREPLPDVSVSRPIQRVPWGIKVPGDPTQTVYVWLDALVNYLSCTGYPNDSYKNYWPADVQVLGKDIIKFHGIYWPAFLMAANLELPKSLFVHSHWTVDGQKMSKSKNNVVNPMERANTYTSEGMRYFLLREGVAHSDGNYSDIKLVRILNSELADTLGNLLSRCCAKSLNPRQIFPSVNEDHLAELNEIDVTKTLIESVEELPYKCLYHYQSLNFYLAIDQVIAVLHTANSFFETTKPWELKKGTENDLIKLETILCITMETLRICGIILQPIIPNLSKIILNKLNVKVEERFWCDLTNFKWQLNNDYNVCTELTTDIAVIFKRIESIEKQKEVVKNIN